MLCQACGKKTATTHIQTVVNGKLTQYHLCADCAKEKGYSSLMGGWGLGSLMGGLMEGLLGNQPNGSQPLRCKSCGATFEEISRTGKIGCADCYRAFRSRLMPMVQRIHGTARHKGKIPGGSALRVADPHSQLVAVKESPIEEKRRLLKKAVEAQDFEQAAVLRDEIKEMENHG